MVESSAEQGQVATQTERDDKLPRRVRVMWMGGPRTLRNLGRTLQPLAIGLMDELVDVTVACPEGVDVEQLPCPPMEVVRYGRLRRWIFRSGGLEGLVGEIRSRKIELLHALDVDVARLTRWLGRLCDVKYMVSSYAVGEGRRLGRLDNRAAGVLAASEPVRSELLKRRVIDPGRVHLVRPGVYHARHATCFTDPQSTVAIVAGGPLQDAPAFDAVLQSFAEVRARNHDCAFFILGSGKGERRLRARAEKLDLRSHLTLVGSQPAEKVLEIYKGADIYVSPGSSDSAGMQSLLAMAAGVPVLAAREDAGDFLIDGETARLFPRGDAKKLTRKLTELLEDHAGARAMAERALEHIRKLHSPAEMVSTVARVYRQVV